MAFLRVARAAALTSTAALTTVAYATSNNNASCRVSHASPSTSTSTTNTSFQHHVLGRSNLDVQYLNKKLKQFSNSRLGNGLSMCSYPANKPIEDRACASKAVIESDSAVLVAKSGEVNEQLPGDVDELVEIFSVFDGHGGYQVADFASVRCICC